MRKRGIELCFLAQCVLGISLIIVPSMGEGSGSEEWTPSYKDDLENCEACNNFQGTDYDTAMEFECIFEKNDPEECYELYAKCLKECHSGEEEYLKEMDKYFQSLSLAKKFRIKRLMSQDFTDQEQHDDMKKIIKTCATDKLHLNQTSLPFTWDKRSKCKNESILDTMVNSQCRPVWTNRKDRMDFYKGCLEKFNIRSFKRRGVYAARSLKSLAFELHKLERENANTRVGTGAAMIAGGIMAGIGVLLAPISGGGSLAITASTLAYAGSAVSFGATLRSMFGETPDRLVRQSMDELKDLRDEGNSILALLLLYIVSHKELNEFVKRSDYKKLVEKHHQEIQARTTRNMLEQGNIVGQLPANAKLTKKVGEKIFSKVSKLGKGVPARTITDLKNIKVGRLTTLEQNMAKKSFTSVFKTLPRVFRNSKAVTFMKNSGKMFGKIPAVPLLASTFSFGVGIWEVFEGHRDYQRGMHHQAKLASRRTTTATDDVIKAYVETMGVDENDANYQGENLDEEEQLYAVYAHVSDGNWDYQSGLYFTFHTSNGSKCQTETKYGVSKGWLKLDSAKDLGRCHKHVIKKKSLGVSVTSVQNSLLKDEVTIDAVEVATDGRFLPTFRTNSTTGLVFGKNGNIRVYYQRCVQNSTGISKLIKIDIFNPENQQMLNNSDFKCVNMTNIGLSASYGEASDQVILHPIRNRLVRIKTHTSTESLSGTDANVVCRIDYKLTDDLGTVDRTSFDIPLDNYGNDREWDESNLYRGNDLANIGLEDVLDSRPLGALSGQQGDHESLNISFKNDGTGLSDSWNVDLIKLYFIGEEGQEITFVCHTGAEWIPGDNQWYEFNCEMYKPENPLQSIEQLNFNICDQSNAGSGWSTPRLRYKICKNGQDFHSNETFEIARQEDRCCTSNYFNAKNGYTRDGATTIDGNVLTDDGGEMLGQCEGFDLGSSSFGMVVENKDTDAVCIDEVLFYGNAEKSLKSSISDTPFRKCRVPSLWAESQEVYIDGHGDCTWRNYGHSQSKIKCPLYSEIDLQSIDLGVCEESSATSDDPFILYLKDSNGTKCTTAPIKRSTSGIITLNRWKLGSCYNKRLTGEISMGIILKGSDRVCVNYFKFNDKDEEKSSTCHYSNVYADSHEVSICPRSSARSYDEYPIQCAETSGRKIQRIALKASDKENAGTAGEIQITIRNSKGQICETDPLKPIPKGNYMEYSKLGGDCDKQEMADYVHVWVSTVEKNDDLYLTHFYLDVADENGVTSSIPCTLDQQEEFHVTVHGQIDRFGIPLKCIG